MLAARARGVGSAIGWFVGGVSAAKHLLGAPEGRRSGHNFRGYPKEDARRGQGSTRKPLSEILYEERYGA